MALRRWADNVAGGAIAQVMRRLNARHPWNHNDHFHDWVVANLPQPCQSAFDVGCGRGELLARLAPHVDRVVGTDLDAVTMIAVLHHLEAAEALHQMSRLLVPGGHFLAVGIALPTSLRDHLWDTASAITNPVIGFVKHPRPSRAGPQPPPFPVRDPSLSFAELDAVLKRVMPEPSCGAAWPSGTRSPGRSRDAPRCGQAAQNDVSVGSATAYAAPDATAVTARTAGQAPIFLAIPCEPPKAARYVPSSTPMTPGPDERSHDRAHQAPAPASTTPPSSRRPEYRAVANPPMRPPATTGAVGVAER